MVRGRSDTNPEVHVSLNRLHIIVVTVWFTALFAVIGSGIAAGAPATPSQIAALVLLGCIPTLVFLAVFGSTPPRTLAEVPRDTSRAARRTS